MKIAILLFDKFTALDAIGPYEVLSRMPGAELTFVAPGRGAVRSDFGSLSIGIDASIGDLPHPDLLLIPGGEGNRRLLADEEVLGWIREAHDHSTWTTSVCTGALVLGAAGLLEGRRATTHWAYRDLLRLYGAEPAEERIVIEGRVVTAAGVSAGIDMALTLVARSAGEEVAREIQLAIEYDPDPPFDSGSPESADPELVEVVRARERPPSPAAAAAQSGIT